MINLTEVLDNHAKWLRGEVEGKRADLRGANLEGANLRDADLRDVKLWNTVGNSKEIKYLQLETYNITYTSSHLQIGCENHPIEDWETFSNERILQMNGKKALVFWNKWRDMIFKLIEMSPSTPT